MIKFDIVKDDISDVRIMWDVIRYSTVDNEWIYVDSFESKEEAQRYITAVTI